MTSSSRTTTVSPAAGRHRARPARTHSPMRHRLAAVAAASGLAAAGLTGVASAADLPAPFSSSGASSDAAGAASAEGATGNTTIDGLLNMVVGSVPETDVLGSLISTAGSLGTGSLAAGSWEGLPLSSTLGDFAE